MARNDVGEKVQMKFNSPARVGFRGILFTIVFVLGGVSSPAYCSIQKMTLLVQQTPNDGGEVTPLAGTYKYDADTEVTLTATPNTGYEFLYWLGDVSDQQSPSTLVRLDKPKIVIAVFEPIQVAINGSSLITSSGGGGGGLVNNLVTIGQPASLSGGGAAKPQQLRVYAPVGEKPPVVPEPATGALLGLGSLFTFAKRRRRKINLSQNGNRKSLS